LRALRPWGATEASRLCDIDARERHFQVEHGARDAAGHGPLLRMVGENNTVEDVLESGQLRDRLELGPLQHLMRETLGNDATRLDNDNVVAQGEHFFTMVGNI